MTTYTIIIRVQYFSVPYSLKIKSSKHEFYLYPGDYVQEMNDLENKIFFNCKNMENYTSYKEKEFLKKDKDLYSYIGFKLDFNITEELEKLISLIQKETESLIILFDYLLSNFHYFDQIYIFQLDNQLVRVIQLNFSQQWYITGFITLRYNLISKLEDFLSNLLQRIEDNEIYIDDFELFLRGKLYIEPVMYYIKKGKRNILDNLSDIWESVEHISSTYWELHKKEFEKILNNDSKATHKVRKIKYMLKDLSIDLDENKKIIIQDIYTNYYNFKKHETSDLEKIDIQKLNENLLKVMCIFERAFTSLFRIYPNIIKFKEYINYYTIEPVNKREDFSSVGGIKERKKLLSKNPEFEHFIRFIEYEPVYKKCSKYFYNGYVDEFRIRDLKKSARIKSIDFDSIIFTIFEVDRDKEDLDLFGVIYEFTVGNLILKVTPDKRISYPDQGKDTLTIKFPTKYFDLLIKPQT